MSEAKSMKPLFYIILLNAVGAALISISGGSRSAEALVLTGAICVVSIICYTVVRFAGFGDPYLFLIISMLGSVGGIMQLRIRTAYGVRQLKWFLLGTACYFLAMLVFLAMRRLLPKLAPLYVGLSVALYAATLIFGRTSHGSRNWIILGGENGLSIQPSELIRIFFVLTLAAIFTSPPAKKGKKKKTDAEKAPRPRLGPNAVRLLSASAVTAVNLGFLLLQREWGIALLFFATYFFFIYVYGASRGYLLLNAAAAVGVGALGLKYMGHIQTRVEAWLDPFADASGKGYQITQSLFAIGEGGFGGRGIGEGSVYFIPEVHSDFIFSAICEEMGILGGFAIVMLYFVLTYRGLKIALACTNRFNKAVAFGLSLMLGLQSFIIIGGVTKMIPLTGITLPFISYGGSSMLTTFAAYGILQAISAIKEETTDEL